MPHAKDEDLQKQNSCRPRLNSVEACKHYVHVLENGGSSNACRGPGPICLTLELSNRSGIPECILKLERRSDSKRYTWAACTSITTHLGVATGR